MTTTAAASTHAAASTTVQINRIYIKATPQAIWDAITRPEWTEKYGYGGRVDYDLRPGGSFRSISDAAMQQAGMPACLVDGEVIEADEPHRLVLNWRMLMDPEIAAEGFTRLTYEIKEWDGFCSLTVTHELEDAPKLAMIVGGVFEGEGAGGGHAWILSDLKSLLETGGPLAEPRIS